jgi:hypothetical protein
MSTVSEHDDGGADDEAGGYRWQRRHRRRGGGARDGEQDREAPLFPWTLTAVLV